MICVVMKILSHASVKKKTKRRRVSNFAIVPNMLLASEEIKQKRNEILHFYWSFSSDIVAVKGLMQESLWLDL